MTPINTLSVYFFLWQNLLLDHIHSTSTKLSMGSTLSLGLTLGIGVLRSPMCEAGKKSNGTREAGNTGQRS